MSARIFIPETTAGDTGATLSVRVSDALGEVGAAAWNRLSGAPFPHLRHEFLSALEETGCLGERYGWLPRHLLAHDTEGQLLGAVPLYLKYNSYGEFVFDWSWADAYERHGHRYYPKLVSASPYTPATGPKILLHPEAPPQTAGQLAAAAQALASETGVSSLHWLFTIPSETDMLASAGLLRRLGCQFHWHNAGYRDFDDYLGHFNAARRKAVRRERRRVAEAGIEIRRLDGHSATDADWAGFHALYESTFDKRGGLATLSLEFFRRIAATMPDRVLLVQCRHRGEVVAAAFCLVGDDTLYGRHWGCHREFDSLHFEACYYQGLEFCIERGLARFEPGAQGEHKIRRGFLPTPTWSAHWIAESSFREAIARFLDQETEGMQDYMDELVTHSPFRKTDAV